MLDGDYFYIRTDEILGKQIYLFLFCLFFDCRMIQKAHRKQDICINCVDPLGRGALTLAIDGENLEMVELLIIMGVQTKDGLLQAINAEFVEAVELLLEHEEIIHVEGEPYVIYLRLFNYF